MEKQNNNSNGFLMGFLLGMAAALLVTTKKGRKILKIFSENGWEKIGSVEDILKKTLNEAQDEYVDGDNFLIEDIQVDIQKNTTKEKAQIEDQLKEEPQSKEQTNDKKEKVEKKESEFQEKNNSNNDSLEKKEEVKERVEVSPFRKAKANTKRFFRGIKKRTA